MSISYLEGAAFETFVEGPSNQAALAAARAVADRPGGGPNPLLLTGPAGVGKSHLIHAIATTVRMREAGARVEVETATGLAERARGLRGGISQLHECDLLLLDGVEDMIRLPEVESVLLELLLGRVPFGRPVVLTSGLPLPDLGPAGADLAEVVAGGETIAVDPPDVGTRLAILRRRAADLTPGLSDEVLAAVARLPVASVRELLAAIQRLVAFQSVSPVPLDPSQARLLVTGQPDAPDGPDDAGDRSANPLTGAVADSPSGPPVADGALTLPDDEFGSFLTEVVASVSHQVDRWRAQVGQAILRYGGEGFRTRRLESLLEQEMPARPVEVVERFEAEVLRLRELEAEAASLDADLAGSPLFRDPDRIEAAETAVALARVRRDPLPAPSAALRLDQLGEGPGNRLALQAVRAAAEQPGTRNNPLVIVGSSGTGKTHLLHGLGNHLAPAAGPVACLSAPAFAGEVRRLGASGGLAEWRVRYQHAGALLLDDLHLLAHQADAQEEFLALCVRLLADGRQVAVTSSAPPAALSGISPRLLTRLEAGLVVDLARPDREIRLRVIKQLLAGTPAEGDAALADWLAMRPADSIRAVQGEVHRLLSAAEAEGVVPTPALAREVLDRSPAPVQAVGRAAVTPMPSRAGQGPEKMVTVWPRISDRLIEELD